MKAETVKLGENSFLFVAINADSIVYLPMLNVMRSILPTTPIFIITSVFSITEHIEALKNGADSYASFRERSEEHIEVALALYERYAERYGDIERKAAYIKYGDLYISKKLRQVYCKDTEITLSKPEFDLLNLFTDYRGHIFSPEQIYVYLCGTDENSDINNAVCCLVSKLRHKLNLCPGMGCCIQTVRKVGYRFTAN